MFLFTPWRRPFPVFVAAAFASAALGAPALTTISDILYKADGTRFNGTVTITWTTFSTADDRTMPNQAVNAEVLNGVLKVQLAPTTNASAGANYQVKYSSQGKFQFTEIWAVPPSTTPLRVRDVRVSAGTTVGTPPVLTQVDIADVAGLAGELNQRPSRGVKYAPSRAAVINASGQLDGAAGDLTDCVRVDGTAGPCGSGSAGPVAFADAEAPAGPVDGSNASFTLAHAPRPAASLALYRNGMLLKPGTDFTLDGSHIAFGSASVPQNGDVLTASYRYAPDGGQSEPASFADAETPAGAIDGRNAQFTLAQPPAPPASLLVYRNGILMAQGADYSLSGASIAFVDEAAPQPGDLLLASYRYADPSAQTVPAGPQVLCGGPGERTNSDRLAVLATCAIPQDKLRTGDRVEVRVEYEHNGAGGPFSVQVQWGGSVVLSRTAQAGEATLSGRIDAAVFDGGTQWSSQTWGSAEPFRAGSGKAPAATGTVTVEVSGSVTASAADALALRNFTVLRYPGT